MNLFIRSARIIDPSSKFHLQKKDIIIEKGFITEIGARLKNKKDLREITSKNLNVSPGWVDLFAYFADPGFEHKEDIESGIRAAAAGGFTTVCCMPNTKPALHSKSEIEYVISKSKDAVVNVKPIGAISRNCEGRDITEIYDLQRSGAVAFSDGLNSSLSAGLMLRGLLYVKPFKGLVISHPDEHSIRNNGLVNEGVISAMMGVPGIPAMSEELIVMRDIYLADYADSRLHFAFVSSPGSLEHIKKAKSKGLAVTCSVSPYNLFLESKETIGYDTNYKVLPPLKEKKDIQALIKGLKDGTIDAISSMHIPQDMESKRQEFDYAEFGMTGLETAYAVVNTASEKKLSTETIVEKFAIGPRKILSLQIPSIEKDAKAELTFFDDEQEWTFDQRWIRSKSKNTPFIGQTLKGKVLGIFNNNKVHLN